MVRRGTSTGRLVECRRRTTTSVRAAEVRVTIGSASATPGASDAGHQDALFDVEAETTSALEAVLDSLRRAATDKRDQGDKFERLMVRFFQTDREWSQRFDAVWTWMEWPDRPAQADLGIDLVARDRETGGNVAIQCKFYDPDSTIYKHHIDSFLAESGRHQFKDRIIVTKTNNLPESRQAACRGPVKMSSGRLHDILSWMTLRRLLVICRVPVLAGLGDDGFGCEGAWGSVARIPPVQEPHHHVATRHGRPC